VVWTLAAAADFDNAVSPDLLAPVLAREAGVGDRVWQKRTAWLREHGWLGAWRQRRAGRMATTYPSLTWIPKPVTAGLGGLATQWRAEPPEVRGPRPTLPCLWIHLSTVLPDRQQWDRRT